MKKIGVLLIFIVLIGACFMSGCVEQENGDQSQTDVVTDISLDDAIAILMSEIIKPSSTNSRISAFLMSKVLRDGDIISPESGDPYSINDYTWFVFIDDHPKMFFSHPTRYVFIDAQDGTYDIANESWPPLINDISMWDAVAMNRGNLIEIFPILNSSVETSSGTSNAPSGDYGDAPDGQNAYYGVKGAFPTLYDTLNSKLDLLGGHTLNVGEETLGIDVSAEVDANDPNDPDLIPNLVDSDSDERMFVILNGQNAQLSFDVTVDENAPDVIRYANVLIDFNQNGNWSESSLGSEWAVINEEVNVTPGSTETIITSLFSWNDNESILPSPVWMRVALTREMVNETLYSNIGGWDGAGQFEYGEIEDHLVYLIDNPPDPEEEWPPGEPKPPGGGGQPPGPTEGPCGSDVNYHALIINGGDSSKHMKQGQYPADQAVDTMTDLLNDQGYNTMGNIGPGKSGGSQNSLSNIEAAFDTLKSQVKCGDHVLIYIIGHGNKAEDGSGINLKGGNGKTNELLTPTLLASYLGKIQACADQNCDEEEVNCHVNVVIESCYCGSFNVPGVTGPGRTVMGSCDDEPADASGGGIFTSGFNDASQDENTDVNDDDDVVSPSEAYEKAKNDVDKNNNKPGRKQEDQEPWVDRQECECRCPATPSITGGKYVWDGASWVDEISVSIGDTVQFRHEIENDGSTKNIIGLNVVDIIPLELSYNSGSATLFHNGVSLGVRHPCNMMDGIIGLALTWGLIEIPLFSPGDTIAIEYSATTLTEGTYTNSFSCTGYCELDSSVIVSCEDTATVIVS